jgi:hypothetical protein
MNHPLTTLTPPCKRTAYRLVKACSLQFAVCKEQPPLIPPSQRVGSICQ